MALIEVSSSLVITRIICKEVSVDAEILLWCSLSRCVAIVLLEISDRGFDCCIAVRVIAEVCLLLQGVNIPLLVGLIGCLTFLSADDVKEFETDSGLGLDVIAFGRSFPLHIPLFLFLALESFFEYVDILALFYKTLD